MKPRLFIALAALVLSSLLLASCVAGPAGARAGMTEDPLIRQMKTFFPPISSIVLAFLASGAFVLYRRRKAARKLLPSFELLEKDAALLRAQLKRGEISDEACKAQLLEMMVQDEQGRWWTVGKESGVWYRHDGQKWLKERRPPAARDAAQSPVAGKPWMLGVVMTWCHVAVIVALILTIIIGVLFSLNTSMSSSSTTVEIVLFIGIWVIVYALLVMLVLLLSRNIWASRRGDWIVIGFGVSVGAAALFTQSGLDSLYKALIATTILTLGTLATLFFTRKVWA